MEKPCIFITECFRSDDPEQRRRQLQTLVDCYLRQVLAS